MAIYSSVVTFFQNGGAFMYPIVLILALGTAIAVERWVFLTMTMAKNKALWNAVTPYLKSGNLQGAMQVTQKSDAAIGQIMTYGLNRVRSARRREDIEQAMEESLMEILPRPEKRTHYLATFANMSTLAGLLGTITGMIKSFGAAANADPTRKATLLAEGISEAMNCTAFGIAVALIGLIAFALLNGKTQGLSDDINEVTVQVVNLVVTHRQAMKQPGQAA